MARRASILLLLTFIVCVCATCTRGAHGKLVADKFDAMNRHDVDAIARLYSDSAAVESPNWQGVVTGPAGVRDTYSRYFNSSPDLKYRVTHVVEGTNSVTVEYTSEGTIEHNEEGVPDYMRGKHYVLKNITRMDIRNGKIVGEATYFDQVSFLRQMGFFEQSASRGKQ